MRSAHNINQGSYAVAEVTNKLLLPDFPDP